MSKVLEKEDLLIELGLEELPPKSLQSLSQAFANIMEEKLQKASFNFESIQSYATPRRLSVVVSQLNNRQAERKVTKRGPAEKAGLDEKGNPSKALLGFAESCGVEIKDLKLEKTEKGAWYVFKEMSKGKTAEELIPGILSESLSSLPLPKRMRWGAGESSFVRPVHWVVLLFGNTPIHASFFGIKSDRKTWGHRFHAPQALAISKATDYENLLEKEAWVIPSVDKRRAKILEGIQALAKEMNFLPLTDQALVEEVTALVEWPVVLLGSFDPAFLTIPREALIAAMQVHQKCFPVTNQNGELLNKFIIVSNIQSKHPKEVIQGNEAVMQARLADAAFYFEQDQKKSLEERREDLKHIVFQQGLGTLFDKTERVQKLSREIAEKIGANPKEAERAAILSKADLVTNMVNEFPELQGIMGKYYALKKGESENVALAIQEHYHPRFANDSLPTSKVSQAVAIADRVDTLAAIFYFGERPTGEKDPFGLRRQALGLMRILIEKSIDLDLELLFNKSLEQLQESLEKIMNKSLEKEKFTKLISLLLDFCFERLRAVYQEQEIPITVFEAVRVKNIWNPYDFDLRIKAVNEFRLLPEAESLAAANKRVKNILLKSPLPETVKEIKNFDQNSKEMMFELVKINEKLLKEPEELALAKALRDKRETLSPLLEKKHYTPALKSLSTLKEPIDDFFDKVMVMVEDEELRKNRLALLAELRDLFLKIADISLL